MEELWNQQQIAEYLGVSEATIIRWRRLGQGPEWFKLGHAVRYRPSVIEAWVRSNQVQSTGGAA